MLSGVKGMSPSGMTPDSFFQPIKELIMYRVAYLIGSKTSLCNYQVTLRVFSAEKVMAAVHDYEARGYLAVPCRI